MIIAFSEAYQIKYRIIRLCNILGKGDKKVSNMKNGLTWMVNKLKINERIELYDKGEQTREIMHIYDACKAIELICRKGKLNQIYNVGSGELIKVSSFISDAKEKLKSKSEIILSNVTPFIILFSI